MVLIRQLVYYCLWGLFSTALTAQQVILVEDTTHVLFGQLVVEGVSWSREELQDFALDPQKTGARHLQVFVGKPPHLTGKSPIWGSYRLSSNQLQFQPRFPFELEQEYYYRLIYDHDTLEASFKVNSSAPVELPQFLYLEPDLPFLPVNVLRFYLYFSVPMRRDMPYNFIHLINQQGDTLRNAFFPADPPLWDRDGRRLTLLFDPGRIKSGLDSHEAWGLALQSNQQYTLAIGGALSSYRGEPLATAIKHQFKTVPADSLSPQIERWIVTSPRAGSLDSLRITFDEPIDQAQARRWIKVYDQSQELLAGMVHFNEEGHWMFIPDQPWELQTYRIRIHNQLEDLAGNSLRKPFEMGPGGTETLDPATWFDINFRTN